MQTVFSHIVQKRFSQVGEDVATDALAYVLQSSEAARRGMMRLLRGLVPDLPSLRFKTQQTTGAIRPDMWGFSETEPRVYLENKFWAGLTDNQPISYLEQLAKYSQPAVLLVVAPAAREQTLWRELNRRLIAAGIVGPERGTVAGIAKSVDTQLGPILALTSWTSVLSVLEHETVDDLKTRGDLAQLRSLCDAADSEAFIPVCGVEMSDQRTLARILQLNSVVNAVVDLAITENVMSVNGLRPQASGERIGRYVWIPGDQGAGAWLGIHFGLWRSHGATPLWLLFSEGDFGRAPAVSRLIEPWAAKNGVLTATNDRDFVIGLDIAIGEEKAGVIRSLVEDIKTIAAMLEALPPRTSPGVDPS